jgi:hypothetical protein
MDATRAPAGSAAFATPDSTPVAHETTWRSAQYHGLLTPVYCWQRRHEDFVLIDFNDAANDLTMGYISDLLGQPASRIFADAPRPLADLYECSERGELLERHGPLRHPGLKLAIPGSAYYLPLPPDMVIVQVSLRAALRKGTHGRG